MNQHSHYKNETMVQAKVRLLQAITKLRPKWATGVYITSTGISFSRRTNPRKFPENFVLLWPKT